MHGDMKECNWRIAECKINKMRSIAQYYLHY